MLAPDRHAFHAAAARGDLVPVCREIIADLDTPLTVFAKVALGEPHAFLLESLEGGEEWGRYSFIGLHPLATFSSRGGEVVVERHGERRSLRGDPLHHLEELLSSYTVAVPGDLPRFFGGAVGFLGYDMVRFMERLPATLPPLAAFPDSSFIIPRTVLVHDNLRQRLLLVEWVSLTPDADRDAAFDRAVAAIDETIGRIRAPLPERVAGQARPGRGHDFSSNMERGQFHRMVERAKEYIRAGDIIQVVLSQRFHAKTDLDPFLLYRALRHINPSPYLFFLRLGDLHLIGSSPEILVRLEDGEIEVRPIAGTRPRGRTEEEDRALEAELLADPKERAEHFMLVDLGRNDVGRVAAPGSVETRDLLVIERYSHVMHIVSGVHGRLAPGRTMFDVLRATFPAGTVSGAPKIRAMEIIEELEPERRGPYAGAVGYFGFGGNMDLCITIRTLVMQGDDLWVQAGAGIVADSDPEREYQETINKAEGMRRAVELAERGL